MLSIVMMSKKIKSKDVLKKNTRERKRKNKRKKHDDHDDNDERVSLSKLILHKYTYVTLLVR